MYGRGTGKVRESREKESDRKGERGRESGRGRVKTEKRSDIIETGRGGLYHIL